MNEGVIVLGWLWVILSLPATRVVFNVVTGRKRWHEHDIISAVLSASVLCTGLLMMFVYALTVVTMRVMGV